MCPCVNMQLRVKCLEALLQLLKVVTADPEAAARFQAAGGRADAGEEAPPSAPLLADVEGCLAQVAAQDPAASHKDLAAQARAVLRDFKALR